MDSTLGNPFCLLVDKSFFPPPIPTHRSYIHVGHTDGAARILCDSSVFANRHCERERVHAVGRERKKEDKEEKEKANGKNILL